MIAVTKPKIRYNSLYLKYQKYYNSIGHTELIIITVGKIQYCTT